MISSFLKDSSDGLDAVLVLVIIKIANKVEVRKATTIQSEGEYEQRATTTRISIRFQDLIRWLKEICIKIKFKFNLKKKFQKNFLQN
jgi:hypothetical protein